MVGRDIGTVVLPDADLKLYLDASLGERAQRRYRERLARGESADLDDVRQIVEGRDETDSGRETAPLRRGPDAVLVDTEGLGVDEVLAIVLSLVHRHDS